jgi:hypothetical protein
LEQLVASLLSSSTLKQDDNNLFQTCHNNWEQAVRTHPDISLTTTLLQLVCTVAWFENPVQANIIPHEKIRFEIN